MEIRCDRCRSIVYAVSPEQIRDGEIEYTFFRCPDCGEAPDNDGKGRFNGAVR